MGYDGWKLRAPEDEPGYDWNQGQRNQRPAPKTHRGTEVMGCDCHHCEDTREFLRMSMEAMVAHGAEALLTRCDGCEHWIIEGAPENGVIGRKVVCARCYGELLDELRAQPVDFHDDIRR